MVITSTNINKTNNHFSPYFTECKKDHDIWCWKTRSLTNVAVLSV